MHQQHNRKRKHRLHPRDQHASTFNDAEGLSPPDPALFIQAHEADIVRGPQALAAAQSLEVEYADQARTRTSHVGDGLIRWESSVRREKDAVFEEETIFIGRGDRESDQRMMKQQDDGENGIWVDRYDARLLLDALPAASAHAVSGDPGSPTGWSDLPSDAEDTFFFTSEETEEFHREKRRRLFDRNREERLKALRAEEGEQEETQEDEWGGSDEELDEQQRELMQRTASHILSSPNPAQLEMRILANHGADKRFAFLRGRWSRAWKTAKGHVRMDMERQKGEKEKQSLLGSLGGLAGYGDSDAESDEDGVVKDDAEDNAEQKVPDDVGSAFAATDAENDDAVKRARRKRAKEWAERRRILQSAGVQGDFQS